jgi:dienelactone hydrolase
MPGKIKSNCALLVLIIYCLTLNICLGVDTLPESQVKSENSHQTNTNAGNFAISVWPNGAKSSDEFCDWQKRTRNQLKRVLGIPESRPALNAKKRDELEHDGIILEKWIFASEPGSIIPAILYRPKKVTLKMPAIVLTYGHGSGKAAWAYHYAAQVYAKLGIVVLAIDPLGEGERNSTGRLGSREHDSQQFDARAIKANRLIMGKLVFDTMRGIDFLTERTDIDNERIGVAGHSLGGAVAGWMAALDERVKLALVCGWAYDDVITYEGKSCTRLPNQLMRKICSWQEYASLSAPHCAVLLMNGDADTIIDRKNNGVAWKNTKAVAENTDRIYQQLKSKNPFNCWFESKAGHRPFFAYKEAVVFVHKTIGTPNYTISEIEKLPTIGAAKWCVANSVKLEKLYGTELHERGSTLIDLNIRSTSIDNLKCLHKSEVGSANYTIEGWLQAMDDQ